MHDYGTAWNKDSSMPLSQRQMLDSLSRMPFVNRAELPGVLEEAHATVHRALTDLLADTASSGG